MKKAVTIVTTISIILNSLIYGYYLGISLYWMALEPLLILVPIIVAFVITTIFFEKTLKYNRKLIYLGVLAIIFISPIAGALYLAWDPSKEFVTAPIDNTVGEYQLYDEVSFVDDFGIEKTAVVTSYFAPTNKYSLRDKNGSLYYIEASKITKIQK